MGKAIGRQRQQAGLTQDQVAEHLNIGMEAVSRMERGIVVPTIARLAELAQLFGCELADLLRETSPRPTEQGIVLGQKLARTGMTGHCCWRGLSGWSSAWPNPELGRTGCRCGVLA